MRDLWFLALTWSQDGTTGVYHQIEADGQRDLWYVSIPQDANAELTEPKRFIGGPYDEARANLSPDGRYLAYQSNESGQWEVFVRRFPDAGGLKKVSVNGGVHPKWSPKGDELFYVNWQDNTLMSVSVTLQPALRIGAPEVVFHGNKVGANLFAPTKPFGTDYETMYDVGPDGRDFVVVQRVDEVEMPTITVVQNWHAEFKDQR